MERDSRLDAATLWLKAQLGGEISRPELIFGDASFRRYFRFFYDGSSLILMDAPPEKEDSQTFVCITEAYGLEGLPVANIVAKDLSLGFLCLSDLGDQHLYWHLLGEEREQWYWKALSLLPDIACVRKSELGDLPHYSGDMLRQEMELFVDWLVQRWLRVEMTEREHFLWQEACDALVSNALEQPFVGVHRDFHSRNLMVVDDGLALIDYQGAVVGPITYDLVSLLRDCYLRIDDEKLEQLAQRHYQQLVATDLLSSSVPFDLFQRWMDLMGLQRHLKAAGIFARLDLRDGKSGYLKDVPRVLNYIVDVGAKNQETKALAEWVSSCLIPAWEAKK